MSLGKFENVGSFIRDCNGTTLRYDQACLQILTTEKISFWSQYEECEGCKLLNTHELPISGGIVLETLSPLRYAVQNGDGQICNGTYQFEEFGQYSLNLSDVSKNECLPRMTAEPDAASLPILTTVVILLSMATLWYIVKGIGKRIIAGRLYARYFAREDNELGSETRVLTAEASMPRSPTRSRLLSLDTFRGFALALMVFVNAGGGGYGVFSHSTWNGLTVADVVFPWFAFAMGQALVLSLNARLRTSLPRITALKQVPSSWNGLTVADVVFPWFAFAVGQALALLLNARLRTSLPRVTALKQVALRSLLMSLAGVVLGSVNVAWPDVRLPGVLQRLAAMYFIVGALECAFMRTSQSITPGRSLFRDIAASWQQWLATLSLVAVQICISLTVAAPGCPRGYAGPGGLHLSDHGQNLVNCTGGIAGYIDRLILGESHLYQKGGFRRVYHTTLPHDPEGLLGILSGLLVVQAGAHATRIMLAYNHARARIMRWVFWSIVFGVTGGALCMFSKNGGVIPINKSLWSVSYCLVTAAMAFALQAVLYFLVDQKRKWGGRPLYYAGQNALFLYAGSELLRYHFPLHVHVPAATHAQLLATHAAAMLIWMAVAVALHRKGIFITL